MTDTFGTEGLDCSIKDETGCLGDSELKEEERERLVSGSRRGEGTAKAGETNLGDSDLLHGSFSGDEIDL